MDKPLQNPNLPAGAIVEEHDDGTALRNDGVLLQPAAENPWYKLATVFDAQSAEKNSSVHEQNLRVWNGWVCRHLDENARTKLAETAGLAAEELLPLSSNEEQALIRRFGSIEVAPEAGAEIDMSELHFNGPVRFMKCVFPNEADFTKATCSNTASFQGAAFLAGAYFQSAFFSHGVDFQRATFSDEADFWNVTFAGWTDFQGAAFSGEAFFRSATFSDRADFRSVIFLGNANFQNGAFKARTLFTDARFSSKSPEFHGRTMHQDTRFTLDPKLWPTATAKNAADEKEAHTRLRQIMTELHKPDDAHFFLRMEMAAKGQLGPGYDRLITRAYGAISDYGWSMMRPLAGLFVVWLLGVLCFASYLSGCCNPAAPVVDFSFWHAAGISTVNTLPFIGMGRYMLGTTFYADLPPALKFLTGFQSVSGIVLLFFFGLGLRNRFRLK